jgi:thiol-disulfide isomerase/thioredoxin
MSVLTDVLTYAGISLLLVTISVLGYYLVTQTWPGSRLLISSPPVAHSGIDDDSAKFMFFYTTWCPWSKKAQTPWSSFKEQQKNTRYTYGGKTVTFEEINADSDKGKTALYQIKGYPTFKLETKDKVFEMKGAPTTESFREFLKNALGAEKTV